jgi:hypothetical protein
MRLRVAPLNALVLVILGAANAWLLTVLLRDAEIDAWQPPASMTPLPNLTESANGPSVTKPAAHAQTLAHPVFFKSRLPYVPPPPAPARAAPKPAPPPAPVDPGIAMGGVAIDGVLRKAYLFSKSASQGAWVSEGENFMGSVQSIDATSARLGQADRLLDLQLYGRR